MSLIPEEHYTPRLYFNFTPMVDFLFIIMSMFAILAITHKSLHNNQVNLAYDDTSSQEFASNVYQNTINLSVSSLGEYIWLNGKENQIMSSIQTIKQEIFKQIATGHLSSKPSENYILLHIDQHAKWDPIAQLILSMHQEGFPVYPIYQKHETKPLTIKK